MELKRIHDYLWEIPMSGAMRVPGLKPTVKADAHLGFSVGSLGLALRWDMAKEPYDRHSYDACRHYQHYSNSPVVCGTAAEYSADNGTSDNAQREEI
jgi:hypothetical protein